MRGEGKRWGVVSCLFLSLALLLADSVGAARPETVVPDCAKLDNPQANFAPRAYTLTSIYVRNKMPEYSFVRGQWVLGDVQGVLPPRTCLQVLKREEVGVIQIWYWVRYLDSGKQLRTGWVWAGTKGKDEGNYIGGETTPSMTGFERQDGEPHSFFALFLESSAWAQSDTIPQPDIVADELALPSPRPRPAEDLDYLVELPGVGWTVNYSTVSAIVLFVVMLSGMVAKAIWDETGGEPVQWPAWNKLLRPFLVSPIAFSAFWGPMYVQQGGGGLSLTMALYAFQIGFMWQHVLEKKVGKV